VYTNADLDRVHPFAAQTGGSSTPAVASEPEAAEREPRRRGRGEPYWRDEAARVRERVRALEERAASLRARIAERSRETPLYGRRGAATSSRSNGLAQLQAALAALERRIQSTQYDLDERARRDGALPGWLR
jgi:predicted RNase H-like nuclease (RuvC/YqgF family)